MTARDRDARRRRRARCDEHGAEAARGRDGGRCAARQRAGAGRQPPRQSASGAGRPLQAHLLRDRDRVEVYRPLRVDPKEARRERFQRARSRAPACSRSARPGAKPGLSGRRGASAVARDDVLQRAWLRRRAAVVEDLALALGVDAGDAQAASRSVALACLARAAVVGLRRGDRAPPAAFFFSASAASACFFFSSSALSLPLIFGALAAAVWRLRQRMRVPRPPLAAHGGAGAAAGMPGRRRMFLSGMSGGGGRSLIDVAATLVAPLPLRRGGHRQDADAGEDEGGAKGCHGGSVAAQLSRPKAGVAGARAVRHARRHAQSLGLVPRHMGTILFLEP